MFPFQDSWLHKVIVNLNIESLKEYLEIILDSENIKSY